MPQHDRKPEVVFIVPVCASRSRALILGCDSLVLLQHRAETTPAGNTGTPFHRKAKHVLLCSWSLPLTKHTLQYKHDDKKTRISRRSGSALCSCLLQSSCLSLSPLVADTTSNHMHSGLFLARGKEGFPGEVPAAFQRAPWDGAAASHLLDPSAAPENSSVWDGLCDAGLAPLPASPVPHRKLRFLPQTRHYIGSQQSSRKHQVTQRLLGELTHH